MTHSYAADYPADANVSQEVKTFFEDFYCLSDTPGADARYADAFLPGSTFVLASKKSQGKDGTKAYAKLRTKLTETEILVTRRGMWTAVSSRKHTIFQIYPFGSSSLEFMLRGSVEYELKAGGESQKDWAGHAKLAKNAASELKFEFYQVYLDTA